MSDLVVHHFGPDPQTVGGMASVIRVFTEHSVGADIVTNHATWTPHSQVATARLVATATRAIARMPPSDVAHIHLSESGSFIREGSLVALASQRGLLAVVTMHGASFMPFARKHPQLASTVLRRADVITCLDREILDFVRAVAPGVRSASVPNPIFVADDFLPADAADELVVFAGEIGLRKGADVVYEAWRLVAERNPRAHCLMVGPTTDFVPPDAERLEVRAAVDAREMTEILRRARVVVLPSRAERLPMVLTEAMSLGRPFVSTPVGGIPTLASAGGILVPVGDEIALAESLTKLLADPELARTIGEGGRRFCLRTRSVDVVGARFRELYSQSGRRRAMNGPSAAAR
jgi:glycosyltransferase involved in cell wall biosynthesis